MSTQRGPEDNGSDRNLSPNFHFPTATLGCSQAGELGLFSKDPLISSRFSGQTHLKTVSPEGGSYPAHGLLKAECRAVPSIYRPPSP